METNQKRRQCMREYPSVVQQSGSVRPLLLVHGHEWAPIRRVVAPFSALQQTPV